MSIASADHARWVHLARYLTGKLSGDLRPPLSRKHVRDLENVHDAAALFRDIAGYLERPRTEIDLGAFTGLIRNVGAAIPARVDKRAQAEQLAHFIEEGHKLRARSGGQPLPIRDHNDWVSRVEEYLDY